MERIRIALHAPDMFASLYSAGFIFLIAFQVIINVGVATSYYRYRDATTFISAGGSSLVFLLGGMGILLNISRFTNID